MLCSCGIISKISSHKKYSRISIHKEKYKKIWKNQPGRQDGGSRGCSTEKRWRGSEEGCSDTGKVGSAKLAKMAQ